MRPVCFQKSFLSANMSFFFFRSHVTFKAELEQLPAVLSVHSTLCKVQVHGLSHCKE